MKRISDRLAETDATGGLPLVSAVLAVCNEVHHIEKVLISLLAQKTPGWKLEIIVVDGESSDGTQEIVRNFARENARVHLAINKNRKTPYAFNLGIELSRGEFVCILGAHTSYAPDYIATCLDELKTHGAGGCSGRLVVRPGGVGVQARLIALALASPFGTSTGSMRTRGAGFADTIPYPLFLKSTLLEVGGYNTQLHRNQDNDLSQRIRARGYLLYMTDKTSCEYFVSPDTASLAKYSFKAGYWNIISSRINRRSMSIRHFVPGVFVATMLLSFLLVIVSTNVVGLTRWWLRIPALVTGILYLGASIGVACRIAYRERSAESLLLPVVFFLLHFSYGLGTLAAIGKIAAKPRREIQGEPGRALPGMVDSP